MTEKYVLLDSRRDIEMDEIEDHCHANDIEVPKDNSQRYWDIVNDLRSWDVDDFVYDALWSFKLGKCLVRGTAGLWYGRCAGGTVMDVESGKDVLSIVSGCDDYKVVIEEEDGLVVYGYHHDGVNRYVVRRINSRGMKYVSDHGDYMDPQKLHERLVHAHFVRKVTLKDIQQ